MAKTFNVVMVKLTWWSGFLLLILVLAYVATGYSMSRLFGFDQWLKREWAYWLHDNMDLPLGILLAAHVLPSVYFAIRRSRWMKGRTG